MQYHVCRSCGELLPETAYIIRKSGRQAGYRMATCRACKAKKHAEWKAKPGNAKRCRRVALKWYRDYQMQQSYGINEHRYQQLVAVQGGRCAICGAGPGDRRLAVDHDHVTGAVRGLLCASCNNGLGRFKDSPEFLRSAAQYLEAGRDLRKSEPAAVLQAVR